MMFDDAQQKILSRPGGIELIKLCGGVEKLKGFDKHQLASLTSQGGLALVKLCGGVEKLQGFNAGALYRLYCQEGINLITFCRGVERLQGFTDPQLVTLSRPGGIELIKLCGGVEKLKGFDKHQLASLTSQGGLALVKLCGGVEKLQGFPQLVTLSCPGGIELIGLCGGVDKLVGFDQDQLAQLATPGGLELVKLCGIVNLYVLDSKTLEISCNNMDLVSSLCIYLDPMNSEFVSLLKDLCSTDAILLLRTENALARSQAHFTIAQHLLKAGRPDAAAGICESIPPESTCYKEANECLYHIISTTISVRECEDGLSRAEKRPYLEKLIRTAFNSGNLELASNLLCEFAGKPMGTRVVSDIVPSIDTVIELATLIWEQQQQIMQMQIEIESLRQVMDVDSTVPPGQGPGFFD